MSNKDTDILLIRKYLSGELDARAMHQLERRAQDDPFLMDALEGYEKAGREQQSQLDEISERLNQRIKKKEQRIIPWRMLSIAASVLIVVTIGGELVFNNSSVNKEKTARVMVANNAPVLVKEDTAQVLEKKAPVLEPQTLTAQQHIRLKKNKEVLRKSVPAAVSANEVVSAEVAKTDNADKDATPLNEMIVMGYTSSKKKDTTRPSSMNSIGFVGPSHNDSIANVLQGRAAGVSVTDGDSFAKLVRRSSKNRINGRVIAKDDGQPIIGATVKIAGSATGTVTDLNGKFSLNADSGKTDKLVIAFIGYNKTEVLAQASDSLRSIALMPAASSLNEVVVTGYSSARRTETGEEPLAVDAHPINGWSSLKKYFDENAVSPDGKKGVVKLSFMVSPNGNITNIKVSKSLSVETDAKAIDLINNGPGWVGSTSGRTEEVTVRVKFTK